MNNRNEFLELDGLFFESDTHEWFHDKISTNYAQNENLRGASLKNIVAFVVRDKKTGEYNRVLMDKKENCIIYDSKNLEEIGVHIDKLKLLKVYNIK